MKNKTRSQLAMILILFFFLTINTSQAGLVVNISNHNGYAQFSFSGSDVTMEAGGFGTGLIIEGLLRQGIISDKGNGVFEGYSITSGEAGFSINGDYFTFDDVWIHYYQTSNFQGIIGFRNVEAPLHEDSFTSNTLIELSGSITTDILYREFSPGSYSFDSLGPFHSSSSSGAFNTPLAEGISMNIGQTPQSISEPIALSLMGIGVLSIIGIRGKDSGTQPS